MRFLPQTSRFLLCVSLFVHILFRTLSWDHFLRQRCRPILVKSIFEQLSVYNGSNNYPWDHLLKQKVECLQYFFLGFASKARPATQYCPKAEGNIPTETFLPQISTGTPERSGSSPGTDPFYGRFACFCTAKSASGYIQTHWTKMKMMAR